VRREVERAVNRQVRILPFRIDDVLPSKSLEYFLSSQHWLDAFPPPRDAHYERLCASLETILRGPGEPGPATRPRGAQAGAAAPPPPFGTAQLARIEALLADHVGPVARVLVRRAAVHGASLDELALRLASEIAGEPDRQKFIRACRQDAAAH
jgi:hypothetical protein